MADSEDLTKMKVADLKRELKAKGLSTTGNKQELMDRFQKALSMPSGLNIDSRSNTSINQNEGGEDSDEEEEEEDVDTSELLPDDIDEEKLLNAPTESITSTTSSGTATLKRKSENLVSSSSESISQPKKSLTHVNISFDEDKEKENTDSSKNAQQTGPESVINTDRKVIKLSGLSVQERLELRTKKFNVGLPPSAKLEARAERFGFARGTAKQTTVQSNGLSSNDEVLKKRAERFGLAAMSTGASSASSSVPSASEIEEKKKQRAERFGLALTAKPSTASSSSSQAVVGAANPITTSTITTEEPPSDVLKKRPERIRIVI